MKKNQFLCVNFQFPKYTYLIYTTAIWKIYFLVDILILNDF